ncbi:MAG TPA: peptidylprolyl isomerase [Anaeromyxobacter sp.]
MIALLPALLLAAAPTAPAPSAKPTAPAAVIDRVAAVVDGEVITLSEIEERAGADLRRADALSGAERDDARGKTLRRALDQLVSERLLQKQAKSLGLEVTDAQVEAAVEDIKTRNHFDDAQLDRALGEQGLDRAGFRAQIRRELETYQVMQAKVRGRGKVTDEDLRNYYQSHPQEFGGDPEVRVRHIFLPLREDAAPAEEAKARAEGERILQRLTTGEDFAKAAKEFSKGPSAAEGGDIGWLRRGTVQKVLEDAAFALEDGKFSGLVRAGPGLHIVKVEERRLGGAKSFEDAKEEIRNRLLEEQLGQTRQQVLDELRKSAVVEVKLPELRG